MDSRRYILENPNGCTSHLYSAFEPRHAVFLGQHPKQFVGIAIRYSFDLARLQDYGDVPGASISSIRALQYARCD